MNLNEAANDPAQAPAQAAARKVRGERTSSVAHFCFAAVLLVASIVLVARSHVYSLSNNLDFIKIYNYNKSAPDRGAVGDRIRTFEQAYGGVRKQLSGADSWLNDGSDTLGCQDMVGALWPALTLTDQAGATLNSVTYVTAAALGSTCNIQVFLQAGPMEEQLSLKNVTGYALAGCASGKSRYTISITSASSVTITTPAGGYPEVIVDTSVTPPTVTFSKVSDPIGYNFKGVATYTSCIAYRQGLADYIDQQTECWNGFSSPACTCVKAFSSRLTTWQTRLLPRPNNKMVMSDVVADGVKRCMELRRSHDVREATSSVYARSSALMIFSVALVMNSLFNMLRNRALFSSTMTMSHWYEQAIFFLLYAVAIFLASFLDGKDGGQSSFETVLAIVLPAFLVHCVYLVWLHTIFGSQGGTNPEPFLHPVTFDVCLCALSLYTLTERGVVQLEYLVTDVIKCHVVSAVYIAVIWYYKYGRAPVVLNTEFVQQAYLTLFALGLTLSGSGLVVPYPAKRTFEFHWMLPLVFTYIAFLNPGWAAHMRMQNKLNAPENAVVYNFNAVAGFLFLLIGGVFYGYFLADHIQVYGVKHFRYPSQSDPEDYVMLRGLILPTASLSFGA